MKKSIYYGNITSHILTHPSEDYRPYSDTTRNTITFTGFDVRGGGLTESKLDLLYYNRVNEVGEVLSSLVYISGLLDPKDVTEKTYDVKKLYVNTDFERQMDLKYSRKDFTYINCLWGSSKFFTSSISPMTDTKKTELPSNGIPSVKLEKYGVSFDGWYTQMSVGIRTLSLGTPITGIVSRDIVGMHSFLDLGILPSILLDEGASSIYADSNWSPIGTVLTNGTVNPDDTVYRKGTSLANLLVTTAEDNPYIKQDIFILPTYIELYDNAVVQYAEYPTYGNPFPVLRDKHRIIHNYANENNFVEAQYVLQSTEYFRAITHS